LLHSQLKHSFYISVINTNSNHTSLYHTHRYGWHTQKCRYSPLGHMAELKIETCCTLVFIVQYNSLLYTYKRKGNLWSAPESH
jgi:hypothetical protein